MECIRVKDIHYFNVRVFLSKKKKRLKIFKQNRLLGKLLLELTSCYTNDTKLRKHCCETWQLLDCFRKNWVTVTQVCAKQAVLHFVKALDAGVIVRGCSLYERWRPSAVNILDSELLVSIISSHYKFDTTQGHKVKKDKTRYGVYQHFFKKSTTEAYSTCNKKDL